MSKAVEFVAAIAKVQTLADGGIRVTLDLPETAILPAAQLMECKRAGVVLDIHCKTVESNNGLDERTERKSTWQAHEVTGAD